MKKVLFLIVSMLILGLVFAGCGTFTNITTPGTPQEGFTYLTKDAETNGVCVDLLAGQDIKVGEVCVSNDDEKICVVYQLDQDALNKGWLIYETHLYVGDCGFDGVLTPYNSRLGAPYQANPIPGKFPYGDDELDGVEEWSVCIPFDELGVDCGEEVCIAAHAVVKRVVEDAYCETVVEAGDDFFVSDTDTMVVDGNVDGADYPENAFLAHKPGDLDSPYGNVWDTNLTLFFDDDAKWIWESYYVVNPILGDVVTFQKEFEVSGPPLGGTLYIAADNGFAVYLNGELLGSFNLLEYPNLSDLKQPYVNTTDWWYVQSYDLAAYLQQGTNILNIFGVNEYMYTDDVDAAGNPQRAGDKYWNPGGVIFEFDVEWDVVEVCYPEVWEDQTAWGDGDRFNERGNWATYFEYIVECPCTNVPLVINGGFEYPVVTTSEGWNLYASGTEGLGWIVEWVDGTQEGPAYLEIHKSGTVVDAHEGSQYAELDSDTDGPPNNPSDPASIKIYQDLETCPGVEYTLEYAWSPRGYIGETDKIQVWWDGDLKKTHSGNQQGWTSEQYTVTASGYTTRLMFVETGTPNSYGMFLDAVDVY